MSAPHAGLVAKKVAVHRDGKTIMQTKWVNPNKDKKALQGHSAHHARADAAHPSTGKQNFLQRHPVLSGVGAALGAGAASVLMQSAISIAHERAKHG